jgi:transcriptional regulator with XRE-family HTH domain
MANRMRVRRAELEKSQLDIALKVDVSVSQISLIERGHVDPGPELRAAIARELKTTEAELFPELPAAASLTEGEATR